MSVKKQVAEFHKVFGIKERTTPGVPSDDDIRYHLKMCLEEAFELAAACFGGPEWDEAIAGMRKIIDAHPVEVDLPELVDALGDSDYVNESFRRALGVDGEPIAAEIHRANMAKTRPCGCQKYGTGALNCVYCDGTGRVVTKVNGKVQKPDGWTPPDIEGELRKQGWPPPCPSMSAEEKLERLRHALRDAETHDFDAGSVIRLLEAAK